MSELVTFIPAGGLGTRLHPHTLRTPKPLLPMGAPDKCIINFPIDLSMTASEHTWVSTDYLDDQLEDYIGSINGVSTLRDNETIGSGGSLIKHYDKLSTTDSNGDTLILPCDHIYEGLSLLDFWQKHQENEADITLLTVPPKPYGEYVTLTDNMPVSVEKRAARGALSTTGIFILRNQFLTNWIANARRNTDGMVNCNIYYDIIRPSIGRYAVSHYFLDEPGYWEDTGTPSLYVASNMRLSAGRTVIASSAQVRSPEQLKRCVVLPGTVIEEGFCASNSIISSTSDGKLLITKVS